MRVLAGVLAIAAALSIGSGGAGCGDDDGGTPYPADGALGQPDGAPADAFPDPPLVIEYLDPDHGPFAGGTETLLRGKGFTEDMTVTVGGRLVDPVDLEFIDGRRVILHTPPGDPGTAAVEVVADGLTVSSPNGFRYEQVYVDPASGSIAGGTYVRVRGLGTSFHNGDQVTFDGVPMTDITVINQQEITGFTPPGLGGSADVVITGAGGIVTADDAFSYETGADAFAGGFGGGPIAGTLNVTVLNTYTDTGIEGAFVTVGDPATSAMKGTTDAFGHIVFSAAGFVGPVSVAACMPGFERSVFVQFDARDLTIFLVPLPDPMPGTGTFPPGRLDGVVHGQIVFGNAVGIGIQEWDLVPPPRTPTEVRRAFVFPTASSVFSGTPGSVAVEYIDDGRTAWDFDLSTRATAQAVVAVAGLWDETLDPDGPNGPLGPGVFYPFAMGVARSVLVGPGEDLFDVTILIDIPLDAAMPIAFTDPPALNTPGQIGPTQYQARAFVDLGGEGVIQVPGMQVEFAPGALTGTIGGLPPLMRAIGDGSYTVIASAQNPYGANPFSHRIVRGITDLGAPLVVDDWIGVPRAVDPAPLGVATSMHLAYAAEAPADATPTFSFHRLQRSSNGYPEWRIYARGGLRDLPLWDLTTYGGMTPPATAEDLMWVVYEATIPGGDFDHWTYRSVNLNAWSAYVFDLFTVQLPAADAP